MHLNGVLKRTKVWYSFSAQNLAGNYTENGNESQRSQLHAILHN